MPGLMTIGSSRRLELTDGEQVLFVESSSSPMLEAAGSRPASQLTKAKRRVMSVTSEDTVVIAEATTQHCRANSQTVIDTGKMFRKLY